MSNEHARTQYVRDRWGLRAKDKGPEAGFLARRPRTKPWIMGSGYFLTRRIRESCEGIHRICFGGHISGQAFDIVDSRVR